MTEEKKVKLDLGCGDNKAEGFTGVDYIKTPSVDIVHDLRKFPYPFKDNSVDEIVCNHFVEHLTGEEFMQFMDECFRILKKADSPMESSPTIGILKVVAPYYNSIRCWQDPTHKQAISEAKFMYFNKKWREDNKLSHYPIKSDFDFTYGFNMNGMWVSKHDDVRNFASAYYTNVINDIVVTLFKK